MFARKLFLGFASSSAFTFLAKSVCIFFWLVCFVVLGQVWFARRCFFASSVGWQGRQSFSFYGSRSGQIVSVLVGFHRSCVFVMVLCFYVQCRLACVV